MKRNDTDLWFAHGPIIFKRLEMHKYDWVIIELEWLVCMTWI